MSDEPKEHAILVQCPRHACRQIAAFRSVLGTAPPPRWPACPACGGATEPIPEVSLDPPKLDPLKAEES